MVSALVGVAFGTAVGFSPAAPAAAPAAPPRSLLASPQFRQICHENMRRLLAQDDTIGEEELNQMIDQGLTQLQAEVEKRLEQNHATLPDASQVHEGDWGVLGAVMSHLTDKRMQRFGKAVLEVAQSHAEINSASELGMLALHASDLSEKEKDELLNEMLPRRVRVALQERAAGNGAAQQQQLLSAASVAWVKRGSASGLGAPARLLAAAPAPAPGKGLDLG